MSLFWVGFCGYVLTMLRVLMGLDVVIVVRPFDDCDRLRGCGF